VAREELRRRLGTEDLDQQEFRTGLHRVEHPHETADVRDREDDGHTVAAVGPQRPLHTEVRGGDARVGVLRALRVGHGPRGVEEPAQRFAVAACGRAE
jgi:hypothetical protein